MAVVQYLSPAVDDIFGILHLELTPWLTAVSRFKQVGAELGQPQISCCCVVVAKFSLHAICFWKLRMGVTSLKSDNSGGVFIGVVYLNATFFLLSTHYLLLATCCLLATWFLLPSTCYLPPATCHLLLATCYLQFTKYLLLLPT